MTAFLWNVFLATVWALAQGGVNMTNLAIGFALGYLMLWLGRDVLASAEYCARVPRFLEFVLFFLWEVVRANLRVAYDVLTPTHHMRPGVIALPLDAKTDGEITLLANLISLTPGTVCLDVSADRKFLYIHSMYIDDLERDKARLKAGFERRLLELLR